MGHCFLEAVSFFAVFAELVSSAEGESSNKILETAINPFAAPTLNGCINAG